MDQISDPKKTKQELRILKKLDIPDFRHMTKDKLMTFVSSLNRMDPEVAKAAIQQFPNFSTLAKEALIDYKDVLLTVLSNDSESNERVFSYYDCVKDALESLLHDDMHELSFEQKQWCIEELKTLADAVADQERANKLYRLRVLGSYIAMGVTVIGGALAALGGNLKIGDD